MFVLARLNGWFRLRYYSCLLLVLLPRLDLLQGLWGCRQAMQGATDWQGLHTQDPSAASKAREALIAVSSDLFIRFEYPTMLWPWRMVPFVDQRTNGCQQQLLARVFCSKNLCCLDRNFCRRLRRRAAAPGDLFEPSPQQCLLPS